MLKRLIVSASFLIIVYCSGNARTFEIEPITVGSQEFTGTVSYEVEKAYAGNHNLIVTVLTSTKGENKLKLESCELPDQSLFQFTKISESSSTDPTGLEKTEYKYRADINEKADPKIYLITLTFSFPGERNIIRQPSLYVGVRSNGRLDVVPDQGETAELLTGVDNHFRLELENHYPDYSVNIRSIGIESDPAGLVQQTVLPENITIDPLQRESIDLKFRVVPMSFGSLLSGFSDSSRLILNIRYDDGFGRTVTNLSPKVKVRARPRDRVLIFAMIIGVIIGAIIKLYLQRLQQQGVITRREVLIAVLVTSIIGLVVALIALVGKIKIVAFDQTGSYDNPAIIFIISLAGAVGGAQLLSTLLKTKNATP